MKALTKSEKKKLAEDKQKRALRRADVDLRNRIMSLFERSIEGKYSPHIEVFMTELQALVVKQWPGHFAKMMGKVTRNRQRKEQMKLAKIRKKQLEMGL